MKTKICKCCGAELPINAFTKNKTKKDGFNTWCRKCTSEYKSRYRAEHPEEIRIAKQKCYQAKKEQYKIHFQKNYKKTDGQRFCPSAKNWNK